MEVSLSGQRLLRSFTKIISVLWILIFLFQSNTVYYVSYNTNIKKIVYLLSGIASVASVFIMLLFILLNKTNIIKIVLSILFFATSFVFIYWGSIVSGSKFTGVDIYTYWILLVVLFLWNVLLKAMKIDNYLFIGFRKVVSFYAVISLVMWLLCSVLSVIHSYSLMTINWGSIHAVPIYLHIYAQSQDPINFLGINFVRNTGLFAEAPMYSFVLSIALLVNVFIENKFSFQTFILILAIITTASTTGTLVIVMILVIKICQKLLKSKYKNILFPIIIGVGVLGIATFLLISFMKFKQGSGSVSVRIDDIRAGYITWINHPFFGVGMSNDIEIVKNMNPARWYFVGHVGNTGFSSGFMKMLAGGGIFFVLIYLIFPVIKSILNFVKNGDIKWAISLGIMFLISISLVNNLFLFIFLISWMWANIFYDNSEDRSI